MTKLYLIRHAEAEGNLYRRMQGWYDSLVTARGQRQIAALAERFRDVEIDAVYASDLCRTCATAAAISAPHGLAVHTTPALREMGFGTWEDKPWGELSWAYPQQLSLFNAGSEQFCAPGGERFSQLGARMVEAVRGIAAAHPGKAVAVFSHGTAIRQLQGELLGVGQEKILTLGHSDNTAVSCLEIGEGGGVRTLLHNDNSHLPDELSTLNGQFWWDEERKGEDLCLRFRPLDMDREEALYRAARREAWLGVYGSLEHFGGEALVQQAWQQWRYDRRSVRLALLEEEPVGLLQLDLGRCAGEGMGHISFLYLLPQWRRRGLGVQLLGEAVSICRGLGRQALHLCCSPRNLPAQRFYRRWGFVSAGSAPGACGALDVLEKDIGLHRPGGEQLPPAGRSAK